MSYARRGEDSDLYLYIGHDDGLMHCDGCLLSTDKVPYTKLASAAETIEHVKAHRAAGHHIPLALLANLHGQASAIDAQIAPAAHQ